MVGLTPIADVLPNLLFKHISIGPASHQWRATIVDFRCHPSTLTRDNLVNLPCKHTRDNSWGCTRAIRRSRSGNYINDYGDYRLQFDLPAFNGNMHIEDFIEWISDIEWFFNYMDIAEARKVKLVALHFKRTASAWWDQNNNEQSKVSEGTCAYMVENEVTTTSALPSGWLWERFFYQYQHCRQGTRSVSDYSWEFHHLASQTNLQEPEE